MNNNNPTNLAVGKHTACQPDLIQRFVAAELSGTELAQLEDHLGDCLDCQTLIETETADPESWSEAVFSLREDHDLGEADSDQTTDANRSEYISKMVLQSLAPSDDPEMLGRLGPYEVSGVIGQGGMGVVLKAHDKSLNRLVALKVLRPFLAISGAARQRFFREARAAATINHDNVMPIHSVGESSSELPYLVMPYVGGESLQQRIKRTGPFSPTEVVRIGMQIASGLGAAHEQGLVHRDIKPANIILEDGVDKLWITDFGLARLIDDASLTRTGVIAGTPEYMSPEQARGESVDERSDLFSLGAVMYTMATGHPPFRAESCYGVMRRITDDQPRPVREINPEIPDWLEGFIAQLLSKSPDQRVGSSHEIARLLKESLAHMQHPTAFELPEEVATLAPKRAEKTPIAIRNFSWGLAALILIACIVGAIVYGPSLTSLASNKQGSAKTNNEAPQFNEDPQFENESVAKANSGSINPLLALPPVPKNSAKQVAGNQGQQNPQRIAIASEQIFHKNTSAWFSIRDPKRFAAKFGKTQIGELVNDEAMKPFVDQFEIDFKKLIEERGVPIPADICNRDWVAGEISFGLTDLLVQKMSPVVLIRVGENEQEAFKDLAAEFRKLPNSTRQTRQNQGALEFFETGYGTPKGRKSVVHGVANGWLAISTDIQLVKYMLISTKGQKESLSANPSFKKTMARTGLDLAPDIMWFAKPLDIAELVMSRGPNRDVKKEAENEWLRFLRHEGFKVFTGIGGRAAFATADHEMIQCCFVCQSEEDRAAAKPGEFVEKPERDNVLGLFDFSTKGALPLTPPRWVPNDASSCLVLDWNKSSALQSCGPIWDAHTKPGSWRSLLRDLEDDPNLRFDLEKVVAQFDHRTSVIWLRTETGELEIEHPIFVFQIKGDTEFVMSSLMRASPDAETIKVLGHDGFVERPDEIVFERPQLGQPLLLDYDFEEEAPIESTFYVFADSQLLISNNKELLKRLLEKKRGNLVEAEDYIQVHAALGKLTDAKKVNIRHFGRLGPSLRSHYDLFRNGKFEWFKWIASETKADGTPRDNWVQRFDGSKLPKDFETAIAPYLGTFGWVLETEDDGCLITGCVLKK